MKHRRVLSLLLILNVFSVSGAFFASAFAADEGGKTITVRLLDEDGSPVAGGKFTVWGYPKPASWDNATRHVETDNKGEYVVRFGENDALDKFNINVKTPGYSPYYAQWEAIAVDPIPERYEITLEKATTVGGIVVSEQGEPVAGAKVEFSLPWGDRIRVKESNFYCAMRAETDENGVWKNETVPPDLLDEQSQFSVNHPEYGDVSGQYVVSEFLPNEDGRFTKTLTLQPGMTIAGRVVDENGEPVEGAVVVAGSNFVIGDEFNTTTDENGGFAFRNWPETRAAYVGAWKEGKMAVLKSVAVIADDMPPIELVMKPVGKPVTIRIVDKDQQPIEGFYIAIERWGNHRLVNGRLLNGTADRPRTDADGRWTWHAAPDAEVTFDMFLDSRYMDVRGKTVTPRDGEYVFVAHPALVVTGRATDAETGEAITGFDATLGLGFAGSTRAAWQSKQSVSTEYRLTVTFPYDHYVVKLEAPGYKPAVSRAISPGEGTVTIDLALEKLDMDAMEIVAGKVRQPDGTPAAGAEVAMATLTQSIPYIQNGRLLSSQEQYTVRTDDKGEFRFSYIDFESERPNDTAFGLEMESPADYMLVVLHASGFKQVTQEEMQTLYKDDAITLDAWAEIRGTVKSESQKPPAVGYNITRLTGETSDIVPWSPPRVTFDYRTDCDADGRFVIAKVPAGEGWVSRTVVFADRGSGHSSTASHSEKVSLEPGETAQVVIGGTGRPVKGRLILPDDFEAVVDWNFGIVRFTPRFDDLERPDSTAIMELLKTIPKEIMDEMDIEKRVELYETWTRETDEGKKYKEMADEFQKRQEEYFQKERENHMRGRACAVEDDGSFLVENIFAGDWTFELELCVPPPADQCGFGDRIGSLTHEFSVDEIPGGVSDEPLGLGELTIQKVTPPKPMPQPGDAAPDFELRQVFPIEEDAESEETPADEDAPMLKLSDFRGKYVVLDFWATWCGPCLAKLPELKELHEKYKDDERFVMIGISLDEIGQDEMLGRFVAKREMPWLHGLAGNWSADVVREYNVNAIPALFVVDPEGKILMTNPSINAIDRKLAEIFAE